MSDDATAGESIEINLALTSSPSTPRIPLKIPKSCTPSEFHRLVLDATKIPQDKLKIIFRGRIVANRDDGDESVIEKFKIEDGSVVHCMGKPADSGAPTAPAAVPAAVGTPAAPVAVPTPPTGAPAAAASAPPAAGNTLVGALSVLRSSAPSPAAYQTALSTLHKVLDNIVSNPMEEKYRKIKTSNAAFNKRLGGLTGGREVLLTVGFVVENEGGEESFVMKPSAELWNKLNADKAAIALELENVKRQNAPATAAAPVAPGTGAAGMPGMGGGMGGFGGGAGGIPGSIPPGMEGMVNSMLSDPAALQGMLQNPMVRQAMENDPRFAGNPMLRQSMDALANNPAMIEQMSRMMSDPAMRETVMNRMRNNPPGAGGAAGGGLGGMGAPGGGAAGMNPELMQQQMRALQSMMGTMQQQQGGAGAGSGAAPTGTTTGQQPPSSQGPTDGSGGGGGSDAEREMTEEEMIAEAIARSLRET